MKNCLVQLIACLVLSSFFARTLQDATSEADPEEAGPDSDPQPYNAFGQSLTTEVYMPLNPNNPLLGYEFATTEVPGEVTTVDPLDAVWHINGGTGRPSSAPKSYSEKITFYLHTRNRPGGVGLEENVQSLKRAGWKPQWPVKLLIPGYLQNSFKFMLKDLLRAYQHVNTKANIVALDYVAYSDGIYTEALSNVDFVAKVGARFLEFLDTSGMVESLDSVQLIGHSLGAQLAGVIGLKVKQKGRLIGRITGLDPAGPGYASVSLAKRLDKTDAAFVDIIHTNMPERNSLKFSFGIGKASGHADFYPNGGEKQPGCLVFGQDMFGLCSHIKAVEYYERSIRSKNLYPACPCRSWHNFVSNKCPCDDSKYIMGEHCSRKLHGLFYLRT